mmetsp:Transcript_23589/g.52260  ORF Transcript_23589/g.52260 Transcript_23589/m.52260 type:complete len:228 (-) Transcript_23589:893-1576(-)
MSKAFNAQKLTDWSSKNLVRVPPGLLRRKLVQDIVLEVVNFQKLKLVFFTPEVDVKEGQGVAVDHRVCLLDRHGCVHLARRSEGLAWPDAVAILRVVLRTTREGHMAARLDLHQTPWALGVSDVLTALLIIRRSDHSVLRANHHEHREFCTLDAPSQGRTVQDGCFHPWVIHFSDNGGCPSSERHPCDCTVGAVETPGKPAIASAVHLLQRIEQKHHVQRAILLGVF